MEKDEYIGFRLPKKVKKRIEESASRGNLSVGEFVSVAVFKYLGDINAVNEILEKRLIK